MTASPSQMLKVFLVQFGLVSDVNPPSASGDWPCYVGNLPDMPHSAVAIFDIGGTTDGRNHRTGAMVTHPGISVMVRSQSYDAGFSKAAEIAAALDTIARTIVSVGSIAYRIDAVTRAGDVVSMGQEQEKRREMFSINGIVTASLAS